MPLLIAALLGLSAAIIVLYPLLGLDRDTAAESAGAAALSDDAERERSAKLALRDVNFDYRLGNLDTEDYVSLRDRYERRALAAMKTRYEREQALDALIDRQLEALRASKGGARHDSGENGRQQPVAGEHLGGVAVSNGNASAENARRGARAETHAQGAAPDARPRVRRRRGK